MAAGKVPADVTRPTLPASARPLQGARDQKLHDLIGAAVDLLDPRVDEHPRYRVFLHVTVAAVKLQAFIRGLHLLLRAPPLRHRRSHGIEVKSPQS